jgi:hypothetical protein
MAFLSNDAVNRVYVHAGIHALATGAGGLFVLVYLLQAGVPVPIALLSQAAIVAGRFVLRPVMLPLAQRFGVRPLMIVGALLIAASYPLLAFVHDAGPMLWAYCALSAVADVFYWVSYHAWFAALGDAEHRGHQVGAREAIVSAVSIVAPLAGAAGLTWLGPLWTFAIVGLAQAASVLPFLGAPDLKVAPGAAGSWSAARLGVALNVADGWFDAFLLLLWRVGLFLGLSSSVAHYGGAMALAGLVGAACGPLLGRHLDRGGGQRVVLLAYTALAALVGLRAVSLGVPWLAVTANALEALVFPLMAPAIGGAAYNLAKASPCPFRFHLATEAGWDIGCGTGLVVAAWLCWASAPIGPSILMALPGVAAAGVMLWRYYGRNRPDAAANAPPIAAQAADIAHP